MLARADSAGATHGFLDALRDLDLTGWPAGTRAVGLERSHPDNHDLASQEYEMALRSR
jgi:hypothetical protein